MQLMFPTANVFLKMMKLFGPSLKTNDSCKMHADLENKHGAICEKFYYLELQESLSESFGRFQKDPMQMQSYAICSPKRLEFLTQFD